MLRRFTSSVLLGLAITSCGRAAQEAEEGARPAPAQPAVIAHGSASAAPPLPTTASAPSANSIESSSPASASAPLPVDSAATDPTSSAAYAGCGVPIAHARLWDETEESEVFDAIGRAKACAKEHGRRLLLEFVAPWCGDCQEMARLDQSEVVAATLARRFERVRINIGKWDRHEALRTNYGVRALATYIVIDPRSSRVLAKTTLEPVTKPGEKLTAADWARWLEAH